MIPKWAQGAVFYQIFPDRFRNGDEGNDVQTGEYTYAPVGAVEHISDWNEPLKSPDIHRFYGGDLEGVREQFGYLRELGIDAILFNPIFVSPSNHKYDTEDYDNIDPHLASSAFDGEKNLSANEYFAKFVACAHECGIRVILDGVFNHCGATCKWLTDPDKQNYFAKKPDGTYEYWWNVRTLPKLNYDECEELWDEIIRVGRKWVSSPYNCDGWRLDVAPELAHTEKTNHLFWERFTKEVKEANPEAFIFAEIYDDPEPWLSTGAWDSAMNYRGFFDPVSAFFTGMEKHSDEHTCGAGDAELFAERLFAGLESFPGDGVLTAINQLDNHDHSRFLTRTGGHVGRIETEGGDSASADVNYDILRQAVTFQMTWPGAPTLYYGDETGMCGWTDPDSRRTFPWNNRNLELEDFYKHIIRIHKESEALRCGRVSVLTAEGGVFAFARTREDETVITIINREENEREIKIPLAPLCVAKSATRLIKTGRGRYNVGRKKIDITDGTLTVTLPEYGSAVYLI